MHYFLGRALFLAEVSVSYKYHSISKRILHQAKIITYNMLKCVHLTWREFNITNKHLTAVSKHSPSSNGVYR